MPCGLSQSEVVLNIVSNMPIRVRSLLGLPRIEEGAILFRWTYIITRPDDFSFPRSVEESSLQTAPDCSRTSQIFGSDVTSAESVAQKALRRYPIAEPRGILKRRHRFVQIKFPRSPIFLYREQLTSEGRSDTARKAVFSNYGLFAGSWDVSTSWCAIMECTTVARTKNCVTLHILQMLEIYVPVLRCRMGRLGPLGKVLLYCLNLEEEL